MRVLSKKLMMLLSSTVLGDHQHMKPVPQPLISSEFNKSIWETAKLLVGEHETRHP